ncbi:MAG: hypothetical protein AVDCRST_MAG49-3324 [uncultured Thermomicrobiales bacterium]|uniref:Uncharacterized protein n=1 Tax=uncultured Thermomicrobiales bacterium TaxID=1645740 RepID=A0A6J4V685_9BACT|nr:MAG: hypothetical protein AVDCRST_MAG49-3324 [uncultured Thermomicrobiales bacterium]
MQHVVVGHQGLIVADQVAVMTRHSAIAHRQPSGVRWLSRGRRVP